MSPADEQRVTRLASLRTAAILYGGSGDLEAVIAAAQRLYAVAYGLEAEYEAYEMALQEVAT